MEIVEQLFFVLACIAAVGFLVSGLDDLFFDSHFLVYLWRNRRRPPVLLKDLKLAREQWVAVLVPAWQEGGVVNKMAEYATRVVLYERYDIFIGVYPNDPATNRCVDEICATHPRIHKVVVPHPGPTSKADCLNWIYRAMRLHEVPGLNEYAVVAIHDAEDVLHPLVLKVYNYFVPQQYDMAQLPVFALELPLWKNWVGNTYIDDFAESHTKDLFARQSLGGIVPSAGVGTAFSRPALDRLAADRHGDPFRVGNLTEDYEVAIRIQRAGFRSGMVSVPVERIVRRKRRDGTPGPPRSVTEVVAVREAFPKTFGTAVRQRSRWILGIAFQTWEQTGWAGSWPVRYTLVRDRRAPLTHLINMLGYLVMAFVLCQWAFARTSWGERHYLRPLFSADSWLWKITIIDTALLGYRGVQRFISVMAVYSWSQALASIPRVVIGNLINFIATVRATRSYLGHKFFGQPIVWLKTDHSFPAEAELAEYTKTIEDLLVEEGFASREQVFEAVRKAGRASVPATLLRTGLLSEEDFTAIWARHSGLEVRFINPYQIPRSLLETFPESRSLSEGAVPLGREGERVAVAFREPPAPVQLERLGRQWGAAVLPVLSRPSNLAFARDRAYPRFALAGSTILNLPEKFRQVGGLDAVIFLDALSSQQSGRHSLPDVMVDMAILSEGEARRIWADALGCPPCLFLQLALDLPVYYRVGPFFWWLHRLLPVQNRRIACACPRHPEMTEWLAGQLPAAPDFVAELPRTLELATLRSGFEPDPEKLLVQALTDKGVLKAEVLDRIKASRTVLADPITHWLALQKLATVAQMNEAFLELCHLPRATGWREDEVRRLAPLLPPGFARETGCFCLEESSGAVRLGLSQMPTLAAVRRIHDRLAGCAILFQSLSHEEAGKLQSLLEDQVHRD